MKENNTNHNIAYPGLSDVSETGFLTLYCHAKESLSKDPILKDEKAVEITQKLNPALAASNSNLMRTLAAGKVNEQITVHIALRAKQYDDYARDFLKRHSNGTVVNLGCGLDTRFERIDNGQLTFFDLDLPDMIAFKRNFFTESERYHLIGQSVLDLSWLDQVAARSAGPMIFLAEGLFMYLEPEKVKALVVALNTRFPGSELVCEVVSRTMTDSWLKGISQRKMQQKLKMGKDTAFIFGVSGSRHMEDWAPGIQFLDEWSYFDTGHKKLGWFRWLGKFEWSRKLQWTLRYRLAGNA